MLAWLRFRTCSASLGQQLLLMRADLVLIMSVNPGFGGQKFIEYQVDKIRKLRQMCNAVGADPWIEVDGGVTPANVRLQARTPLAKPLLCCSQGLMLVAYCASKAFSIYQGCQFPALMFRVVK